MESLEARIAGKLGGAKKWKQSKEEWSIKADW